MSSYKHSTQQKQLWKIGPFARTTFYRIDGQGRDSYINRNNGGTVQDRDFNIHPISGRFMKEYNNPPRVIPPSIAKKLSFYYCNGTGRDNYIQCDSGGVMGEWNLKNQTKQRFLNSLRNTQSTYDQIEKGSFYNPQLARQQSQQSRKLSQSKRRQVPFESLINNQTVDFLKIQNQSILDISKHDFALQNNKNKNDQQSSSKSASGNIRHFRSYSVNNYKNV